MNKRIIILLLCFAYLQAFSQKTQKVYLSGTGIDNTVEWDFFVSKGMNSGKWSKIPVPSNWEPKGFGIFAYGREKKKPDEQGIYKTSFKVDKAFKGKQVNLVFEGVMTEATVYINGKLAGETHVGGYYHFKYDISDLVIYGKSNSLKVVVDKLPKNRSVVQAEREADFWTFGGIYRPVYLEVLPKVHIDRVAVNAQANGKLEVDYFLNSDKSYQIKQSVVDLNTGETLGTPKVFDISEGTTRSVAHYENPKLWTCEDPNLYVLKAELCIKGKTVHEISQRFGFRTIETRPHDGIYVNGTRVVFKGVNYHSFHPEWGRATSKALSISDILMMKKMNMNAVRMGHYPHDQHLYDVCDSLGMFVFDELGAYQHRYDYEIGKQLLKEMLVENVNHPSIVIFANGNEGGYDVKLEEIFREYDPQGRFIYHPTHYHNGFDAQHYKPHSYGVNTFHHSRDIFVQTEFLHALYDGGGGAGLADFWEEMRTTQNSGGGFIWAFLDEGVVRCDLNDSIDCAGNLAPDGIVGPYREPEGSVPTIRDVWSPIQIQMNYIPRSFDGRLKVENQYLFNSLNGCRYQWRLETLPTIGGTKRIIETGKGDFGNVSAGLAGYIQLDIKGLNKADVLVFDAFDKNGNKVNTWNWPVAFPQEITKRTIASISQKQQVQTEVNGDVLRAKVGALNVQFNLTNGLLEYVSNKNGEVPLNNGPVFTEDVEVKEVKHEMIGDTLQIRAQLTEKRSWFTWKVAPNGLIKFSYRIYNARGKREMIGVSWDFPETPDVEVKYLGRGPYRVWNNRKRGLELGVWEKTYNNTKSGCSWNYPEFKGYHADIYWAEIRNSSNSFKIYNETDFTYLRLFTPEMDEARNCKLPCFPVGGISLMSAIPAIGTKINEPNVLGVSGLPHNLNLHGEQKPLQGDYWFDFR
ncbi:glycoside hydrolase family 2 [Puteibacter caeruleilacunae]|nr:glycoside hydrolase family 2 [Puteibacter caeruleilacunae]